MYFKEKEATGNIRVIRPENFEVANAMGVMIAPDFRYFRLSSGHSCYFHDRMRKIDTCHDCLERYCPL